VGRRPSPPPSPIIARLPGLIDHAAALADAVATLARAPAVALDTETDAYFAYRPQICLLQLATRDADFLVDPLAPLDLAPLGDLLADPAREVVIHAAENDVILMRHQFGWRIGRLFDTQVACFVLGLKPYSLAGILESRFGVVLDKKLQRSDWSRRPLAPEQVAYALADTRHLLPLAGDLRRRVEEAGRAEEVASECARIAAREWAPEPADPEAFRRVAGVRDLDPVQLRIFRDLHAWREKEAERDNRAPYRVADDRALLAVARARAKGPVRGVPRRVWDRHGRRFVGIVDAALAAGPLRLERLRRPRAEPPPRAVKERYDRLRAWRTKAAEARGVEPFVVARNEALFDVAQRGCRTLEDLGEALEPFRVREYGQAILDAMLAAAPEPPHNER